MTDAEDSERRQLEFKEKTENFVKNLELDEIDFRAKGFPDELVDNEPEEKGYEI